MSPVPPEKSERITRKRLIDPKLEAAGWRVVPHLDGKPLTAYERCAVEEYPTEHGPADYALCVGGCVLGVVEAKKLTLGPQNVLMQAERYSKGCTTATLNFNGYRVPFLYSTNGEVIWHHDIRNPQSLSHEVAGFHTPDALAERLSRSFDESCAALLATPNDHPKLRLYQRDANAAIERAIANHKRQMLVAMATGTGKTFTLVNEVYRLMKSGVAKRVLFLVDRRALAAQAVQAFASFEAESGHKFTDIYEVYSQRFKREDLDEEQKFDPKQLPTGYLTNPKPGDAFVYVSTIQRMTINLFGRDAIFAAGDEELDDDAGKEDIPIHAFDLVIADECHRGYTSHERAIWRRTLNHFDAIKIGLTATPAAHTTGYFTEVVYRYEYGRAVREGHLVDYNVVAVKSNVRMNGIFLNEGEEVSVVNPDTGAKQLDLLEDAREFPTTEIEEKITSPDSNRKILEELKKYAQEHEQGFGRFPKTLIFAVNDIAHTSHADQLVRLAREIFGRGDSFVQKITGSATVDRPLQRIREFRNRPQPSIVVTVDMLSTGVDIPDLEFIVMLRPVKSRILFEQMLGRGTRKGERHPDKSFFVVFDCFDGTLLEYFRLSTNMGEEMPDKEVRTIAQVIDDIWNNRDREYNTRCLVKRLHRVNKQMSAAARELFAAFIPDGDLGKYAADLPAMLRKDFTGTMKLLRNPAFQDLLVNYPRPPRHFIVASNVQDEVSSEWRVRGVDGAEYKPSDYLAAFSQFVRENPAQIEAIRILLARPKDWSTEALTELRNKLAATQFRFTEENLRKAHEIRYGKALVDIVSMVKHAADEQQPLYTASERVRVAVTRVTSGKSFTAEQHQWLLLIEEFLAQNLTIDRTDFETQQVFTRRGGLSQAVRAFEGDLEGFLDELNRSVVA